MAKQALSNGSEPVHQESKLLEAAARASVDALLERTLTEAEWMRIRSPLLEFVNILHAWDRAANRSEPSETISLPNAA